MGTDLKTLVVLVSVDQGVVNARACDYADWQQDSNKSLKRYVTWRKELADQSEAVLVGFETPVGEFEIHSERGRAMVDLCALYPSIYRLEENRTLYRFGKESELLLFRMQWNWF